MKVILRFCARSVSRTNLWSAQTMASRAATRCRGATALVAAVVLITSLENIANAQLICPWGIPNCPICFNKFVQNDPTVRYLQFKISREIWGGRQPSDGELRQLEIAESNVIERLPIDEQIRIKDAYDKANLEFADQPFPNILNNKGFQDWGRQANCQTIVEAITLRNLLNNAKFAAVAGGVWGDMHSVADLNTLAGYLNNDGYLDWATHLNCSTLEEAKAIHDLLLDAKFAAVAGGVWGDLQSVTDLNTLQGYLSNDGYVDWAAHLNCSALEEAKAIHDSLQDLKFAAIAGGMWTEPTPRRRFEQIRRIFDRRGRPRLGNAVKLQHVGGSEGYS